VILSHLEYGKRDNSILMTVMKCAVFARTPGTDPRVIGSSEQVHVVDALAITGDEGRGSLRKVVGSWQTSFDPQMSEWGNPARMGHP
jgi:hypothetical protein